MATGSHEAGAVAYVGNTMGWCLLFPKLGPALPTPRVHLQNGFKLLQERLSHKRPQTVSWNSMLYLPENGTTRYNSCRHLRKTLHAEHHTSKRCTSVVGSAVPESRSKTHQTVVMPTYYPLNTRHIKPPITCCANQARQHLHTKRQLGWRQRDPTFRLNPALALLILRYLSSVGYALMLSITFSSVVRHSRAAPAGCRDTVATACPTGLLLTAPKPNPVIDCVAAARPAAGFGVAGDAAAAAGAVVAAGDGEADAPAANTWTTTVSPSLSLQSWRVWSSLLRMRPWKMMRFGSTSNCDLWGRWRGEAKRRGSHQEEAYRSIDVFGVFAAIQMLTNAG